MNLDDYTYCGFRRIVCAVPDLKIADVRHNINAMTGIIDANPDADIILFPELSVTGYSCADLFGQNLLLNDSLKGLASICDHLHKRHSDSLPLRSWWQERQ